MRKKHLRFAMLGLCTTSFLLFSCVDKDYDLSKDIDLTIQVGGDLSLPGCNTEEITLKKIFDLDEDDPDNVIKTDESGNYALRKKGSGSDSDVQVDPVKVSDIESSDVDTELTFKKAELDQAQKAEDKVDNQISTFTVTNNEVTKDIVDINYADTDPNDMMPADVVISFNKENEVTILHLQDFTIDFPDFLGVQLNKSDPDYRPDYQLRGNQLYFASASIDQDNGGQLRIPLQVSRFYFKKMKEGQGLVLHPNAEYNELFIEDDVVVNGQTYILSSDFPAGIAPTTDISLNLNTKVILGDPQKDVKLTISKVKGIVDPNIEVSMEPVSFDNLPDFLQDEDVIMDITNPSILLTITNTAPVDVNIYGDLVSYRGANSTVVYIGAGPEGDTNHRTDPILVRANTTSQICLSRLGTGAPEGGTDVRVENLNDLIEKIPDNISLENIVAKALQKEYDIDLGETYHVSTDYFVDAPLKFGENLDIVYRDTINDWNSDIVDNGIEVKVVNVEMNAINKIPLNLELSAIAIDVNSEEIEGIVAEVSDLIKPGNGIKDAEGGEVVTPLTIKLTAKEGEMKKLDGLLLKINATNKDENYQDVWLNEKQTLKLDNIRIKVPGGVKLNLN